MKDQGLLDNPIWHALSTVHAHLAEGSGLARRYPADIGPLSAIEEQSPYAYRALAELLKPEESAVLFLTDLPSPPDDWRVVTSFPMEQMVCCALPDTAMQRNPAIAALSIDDVPEMRRLAKATEPGPFRNRTIELGGYLGICDTGRLAAMSGRRLALPDFIEVSAVCTYPEFRGRGYAGSLVAAVARGIFEQNKTPFLGVRQNNAGAIRVYEKAGFNIRRSLHIAVLKRPI